MNRIDRLTAILIHLQTKKVVKAEEISNRFDISLRTVYRDVKALMEAGVPIGSEAGKGYFIVDGYHLPPVMFTQDEAGAMLVAAKLVDRMTDESIRTSFESALLKIKAVLNEVEKDRLEYLQSHIEVFRMPIGDLNEFPNNFITNIQKAVVEKEVLRLNYYSTKDQITERDVEPIGLFYYSFAWHLIAYCRMREDYRDFRTDRIKELTPTGMKFENRNIKSIQDYMNEMMKTHREIERVVLIVDKNRARYMSQQKHHYGLVSEEEQGDKLRMTFMTGYPDSMARWILLMGKGVEIESSDLVKSRVHEFAEDLYHQYLDTPVTFR